LGQFNLRLTQLPDNLLRGMSLLGHLRLLPGSRILTFLLDRFQGAGSAHVLGRINQFLHDDLHAGRFVTFVVGLLDGARHEIDLLSAGHGPLLVYRAAAGTVDSLHAHGAPLAVMEDVVFDGGDRVRLEPGDFIMLVTDGFYEWRNPTGEQFGMDRINRSLVKHAEASAAAIIAQLYREVREFTAGTAQADDVTALVVKREASGGT
ncbi:MAG: PP2C family protein-serine/threonine phosphatase, partial [Planctomycetota bacterium]|nr:PP2C family protein-serine/threonine phosphatase [Planctomycetota bacterium]